MISTLVTKAHALLLDSKLPDELWAEAVHTANYVQPEALRAALVGELRTSCSMEPLQIYRISGDMVASPIS